MVRSYLITLPLTAVCLAGILWSLNAGLSKSKAARYVFIALLLILVPYGITPLIYSALRSMSRTGGESLQFMYTSVSAFSSFIHAMGIWFLVMAALKGRPEQEQPPRSE